MKSRILYLDIIRIFACAMIVAMHAPIPNTGQGSIVLSADSFFTAPGIGLFVMVSGALLLPVSMPTKQFLKKRLGKIAFPTLFWTFFYMLVYWYDRGLEGINLWRVFLTIPFSPQFSVVLWFMYMLAGLYLLAPILSPWLKHASIKELRFYLSLWTITLCYPYIRNYVGIYEGYASILCYFGGYVGYFILGFYLRFYIKAWTVWKSVMFLLIPLIVATVVKILQIPIQFYDSFGYLSLLVAMMSVAWFLLIKQMNVIYNDTSYFYRFIALASNCCFGIYLVHIFVMRSILWNWSILQNMGGAIQIVLVTMLTFIGSFLITWLISYLPGSKYIVGFRHKK